MPQARDSQIPLSSPVRGVIPGGQRDWRAAKPNRPDEHARRRRAHRRIALLAALAALLFGILLIWLGVSSVHAEPVAIADFEIAATDQALLMTFRLVNDNKEPVRAAGSGTVEIYDGLGTLLSRQRFSFVKNDFDRASTSLSRTIPKTTLDVNNSLHQGDSLAVTMARVADALRDARAVITISPNQNNSSFTAARNGIQLYRSGEALMLARRAYFADAVQVLEAELDKQWPFAVTVRDYVMIGDRGLAAVGRSGSEIIFYPSKIYDWYLLETRDGGRSWDIAWRGDTAPLFTVELVDRTKLKITTASGVLEANFEGELAVDFIDANLEAAIREAIGVAEDPIYPSDLEGLSSLHAGDKSITDLTGLEHCRSLAVLHLQQNQIGNISALASLTNLTVLILHDNLIDDISPLANLTRLTTLQLSGNQITNISSLAGLTSLEYLYLSANLISDVSPLAGLPSLTIVMLLDNRISDISPLVDNPGLRDGDSVGLTGNPLSEMSRTAYLSELRGRGVGVIWPITAPSVVTRPSQGSDSPTEPGPDPDVGPAPRPDSGPKPDPGPGPAPRPDSGPGPDPP